MAMQEANRQSMFAIVEEALGFQSKEKGRKETLRLRKERRTVFLEKADALLRGHGYDQTEEGESPQRLTRPIDVLIGDQTLQVQVVRSINTNQIYDTKHEKRLTEILATDPDTEIKYSLFSIEENFHEYIRSEEASPLGADRKTIIRNQFGTVASNQEVLRGLQAINFIADQLENQLLDQPTPTTTS